MNWRPYPLLVVAILAVLNLPTASADTLYENGPVEGSRDAWTINFGFTVSDSFTISTPNSTVTGFQFAAWLFPGDVLETAELSITSEEFGGTTYLDQMVSFTQSDCFGNHFGLNTCLETGEFTGVNLAEGTYWVNLQNAVVNTGDPVYWDENSGEGCHSPGCPSQASESSMGSIPSESFTIFGSSGGGTVPEPGSLLLFGSGVVAGVGFLRRKLR
jgi:PEP-CTERM motif-containing protein